MFDLDLSATVVPALPKSAAIVVGAWATSSDGVANRLGSSTVSAPSEIAIFDALGFKASVWEFTVGFADTPNPTLSYFYPAIFFDNDGSSYQVALSRGTGEARGALWLQKRNDAGAASDSPGTHVGVSGVTFERNNKYKVTTTVTGTTDLTLTVKVQRVADGYWLTNAGAWQAATADATSYTHTAAQEFVGVFTVNYYSSAAYDAFLYELSVDSGTTGLFIDRQMVLEKGATYNGITADALAAPSVCYDGTQYVMTVSAWNITGGKWHSVFFTSTDLVAWTYVNNSLLSPSGGDYIAANSGFTWFQGKYWLAYNHYPNGSLDVFTTLAHSTDLLSWTTVSANILGGYSADPHLVVNPDTDLMELWTLDYLRRSCVTTSANGTSWSANAVMMSAPAWVVFNYGEPNVWYTGDGVRYISFDASVSGNGKRMIGWAHSVDQDTTWVDDGVAIFRGGDAWERGQVFDSVVIVADTGDGYGLSPRILYAGSNTNEATDNTNSSIGLAVMPIAQANADLQISAVLDDAVFSGAAAIHALAAFSVTTDSAIFSGSASVLASVVFNAVIDDAIFSGGAAVSGAPCQAVFSVTTDDALFVGAANVDGYVSASIGATTDSVIASFVASVAAVVSFSATTENSVFSGSSRSENVDAYVRAPSGSGPTIVRPETSRFRSLGGKRY